MVELPREKFDPVCLYTYRPTAEQFISNSLGLVLFIAPSSSIVARLKIRILLITVYDPRIYIRACCNAA